MWFVLDGAVSHCNITEQFGMTGVWSEGQVQTDCQAHNITWLQPTRLLFIGPA